MSGYTARIRTIALDPVKANGTYDIGVRPTGELLGVEIVLAGGTSTVDVTATNMGRQIFTKTGITSSTYFPVREAAVDKTGAAIASSYVPVMLVGDIQIAIANIAGGGTVSVVLFYQT